MSEPEKPRFEVIESEEPSKRAALDAFLQKLTPPTLDPDEALREYLELPAKLADYLAQQLQRFGMALAPGSANDPYERIDRKYTRAHGAGLDAALLHIPKWIVMNNELWDKVDKLRVAFEGRIVRILSPGCDAPCLVLRKRVFPRWQDKDKIDVRFVVWQDVWELEKDATLEEVFHLRPGAVAAPAAAVAPPPERTGVFISYSHDKKNDDVRRRLWTHFKGQLKEGEAEKIWDDQKIQPGDRWEEEIRAALARAKVAVLLVSKEFLASEFIARNELPPLLDAAQAEGARVIWFRLNACAWNADTEAARKIRSYQAAHEPKERLDQFDPDDQEEILLKVSQEIVKVLRE